MLDWLKIRIGRVRTMLCVCVSAKTEQNIRKPPGPAAASATSCCVDTNAAGAARQFTVLEFGGTLLALKLSAMRERSVPRFGVIGGLALLMHMATAAHGETVDILLCLAADVSESVTSSEYDLQKQGHAAAIEDPDVVDIIRSGLHGKIAVMYIEWADQQQQHAGVDWQVVDDLPSAQEFAGRIRHSPSPPWIDRRVRNTSISEVVQFCLRRFATAPVMSRRMVIDISSDGTNNVGAHINAVRDLAVDQGVVINALAIEDSLSPFPDGTHTRPIGGLVDYFKSNVVGGPGSFVQVAKGYGSFGEMIRRKFILELASLDPISAQPVRP